MTRRETLIAGVLVAVFTPAALLAATPTLAIDDFDDGDLEATPGLSWVIIADDLMGGASEATLEISSGGADGSEAALELRGTLAPGFPSPFAGAWTAVGADGVPVNLSAYSGIRFWARGTAGDYLVGVRSGSGARAANFMHPFAVSPEWTRIEVRFGDLVAQQPSPPDTEWSAKSIGWIGISTAPATQGDFSLEIDQIEIVGDDVAPQMPMRKIALASPSSLAGLEWTTLATEETGDGRSPRLPDARALHYAVERSRQTVWFRIDLLEEPNPRWFGLNVAIDSDLDASNGINWWGSNSQFRFDRLLTAYLNRGAGYWQGYVGLADDSGVSQGRMDNLTQEVEVFVDPIERSLFVGVDLSLLDEDGHFRLISTVGSSFLNNDDLPNEGSVEVDLGG